METLVLTNVHPFLSSFPNNLKRKAIFICIKMFNNSKTLSSRSQWFCIFTYPCLFRFFTLFSLA